MNILALIPARGGSKGLPGKNIRDFCGKPLLAHAIEVAEKSKYINKIFVSTDCEKTRDVAINYGAEVPFLRPQEISGDSTPDYPVIENAIKALKQLGWDAELIVFLRPTNPFRSARDIDQMIGTLLKEKEWDSIRAVSNTPYPPFWMKKVENNRLLDFLPGPLASARRQDLPEVVIGNGTIEVMRAQRVLETKERFGKEIGFYRMAECACHDIDNELDFKVAEMMYLDWKVSSPKGLS